MKKNKKYSVLMSVYFKENPEWFDNSIKSMLEQTIFPDEFVIVEDGELTDDLDCVVEKYVKKFPNVFKIVKIEKNGGLGPALKRGVEECKNEFIARMDSDDYCLPNRIEKEFEMFDKDPDLGMVGTNVAEFTESIDNVISKVILPETFPFLLLGLTNSVALGIKVSIMSEILLGSPKIWGIGRLIYVFRINSDYAKMFAIIFLVVIVFLIIDFIMTLIKKLIKI